MRGDHLRATIVDAMMDLVVNNNPVKNETAIGVRSVRNTYTLWNA